MNSEHMQFLTPELEHGTGYLESDTAQFGSLWELEKSALEGLTQGEIIRFVNVKIIKMLNIKICKN